MTPEVEAIYDGFEKLGPIEVRKQMASHVYGEEKMRHARTWLELKAHEAESARDSASMAAAREANDLAREANCAASSANDIALRALSTSQTNNAIATAALIAAVIAIAVSIIGIFVK